jgi:hypothetical protein
MLIGDDHIILAKGRDYADIPPVSGHRAVGWRPGDRHHGR